MRQQGRADRNVRESTPVTRPVVHVVTPAGANQPGMVVYKNPEPLYSDKRGFVAPQPNSIATHKGGSQGKYR
jgi:hypothetical protein